MVLAPISAQASPRTICPFWTVWPSVESESFAQFQGTMLVSVIAVNVLSFHGAFLMMSFWVTLICNLAVDIIGELEKTMVAGWTKLV